MDECNKYQDFFTMIKGERSNFPLRIFMTSRKVPDMQRLSRPLETTASLTCIEIPAKAVLYDIERYIRSRIDVLPIDGEADQEKLANDILEKSNGSFLWVRLVLDELEQVYSYESIIQTLRSIPEGMVPYYERTTQAMSNNRKEKHIAKAVLIWTVASSRTLSISELSQALKLDIDTILSSAKGAVEGLCGQLVSVEHDTGLVSLVHPTAREFLLSHNAGEFSIAKPLAHERIALACLKLLTSTEMQPPRNRRQRQERGEQSPFLDYALTQFSEHIRSASSETDELFFAIDRFFRTNVLSWIEMIARKGDLHCIIQTSKNVKAYLDRRAKYMSPLSSQVKMIDGWSIDLSRIVARFGAALLHHPSSIHFLIPPLCPFGSAIHRQFGKKPDGLNVVGSTQAAWDDCIASVTYGEDKIASAVSCGESCIGVGTESGNIHVYNDDSFQKKNVLELGLPVDLIHFTTGGLLVACTIKSVILQDIRGRVIWKNRLRFRCILLTSSDVAIIAVSQSGHLFKWNISDGSVMDDRLFPYRSYDPDVEPHEHAIKAPSLASISPDMEILALAYRGGTVCLWELQSGEDLCDSEPTGWAQDEESKLASVLLFNPNPDINLLLVIYTNHDLSLYDSWSGSRMETRKAVGVGVLSASCSPDGRTLATVDMHGNIQIWDFESLTLLYHVSSPSASFRLLSFTSDGSSLVDIAASGMRIWSPASLIRKPTEDDNSVSDDAYPLGAIEGQYEIQKTSKISVLSAHPSLPFVFAGKFDGEVVTFSTKAGQQMPDLYTHPHAARIATITIHSTNLIASCDVHGVVQVWTLLWEPPCSIRRGKLVLEVHLSARIQQLCFSAEGQHLLIATNQSDQVYSIDNGLRVGLLDFESSKRTNWRWIPIHNRESGEFLLLNDHTLQRFTLELSPLQVGGPVHIELQLERDIQEETIVSAIIYERILILDVRGNSGYNPGSTMFLFNFNITEVDQDTQKEQEHIKPLNDPLPAICRQFIGISERTKSILFLHKNSWLCSINTKQLAEKKYSQHFFVPNEYSSAINHPLHPIIPVSTMDDTIVFCLHGKLVGVKKGLNFQELKEYK